MNRFEWPRVWEAVVAGLLLAAVLGLYALAAGELQGLGAATVLQWIWLTLAAPVSVPVWLIGALGFGCIYFVRPALRSLGEAKHKSQLALEPDPLPPMPMIVRDEPPAPPPPLTADELQLMGVFAVNDERSFQTPGMAEELGMGQLRFDEAVHQLQTRGFARLVRGTLTSLPALVLTDDGRRFILEGTRQ